MGGVIDMERLKIVSLFSGCGGMDLGIQGGFDYLNSYYNELPVNILCALDNDPYATSIYKANFSHPCITNDIRKVNHSELPKHDILLGGFPCQSFSISAQNPPRLGYKDDRGKLFFEMISILKEHQPNFFIAENVKGLLSANNKKAFPMIINEFRNAGYYIRYQLLNAADYGIPQKRERVFIVGFKNFQQNFHFKFPPPTTSLDKRVALKRAIDFSADKEEKWYFSQKAVDGMLRVRDKMNKGRVQDLEQPCNTISAHLAKVSLNGTDPVLLVNGKYRRLTPKEAARIQSFPDNFKFDPVSEIRQYKAIGNAVPPVLMWHIASSLLKVV